MNNENQTIDAINTISVSYEVFQEIITSEIGSHIEQMNNIGEDKPRGKQHFKAVCDLERIRNIVLPDNNAAIEAVTLAINSARVWQEENTL